MNVYTVHLKGSPDDLATLERAVLIREGFSWAALIFGPLWLLWHRLWLALVVWLAALTALAAWNAYGLPAPYAVAALLAIMHLVLGLEAAPLRGAGFRRRRYQTVGVVHGRRRFDAERAFFLSIKAPKSPSVEGPSPVGPARSPGMVGLFPSAGA